MQPSNYTLTQITDLNPGLSLSDILAILSWRSPSPLAH
jgi:hypothetical protein